MLAVMGAHTFYTFFGLAISEITISKIQQALISRNGTTFTSNLKGSDLRGQRPTKQF